MLLARIYEILPERCVLRGGEMRIIAFVIDVPAVTILLAHLGGPTAAPEAWPGLRSGVAPARAPRCGSTGSSAHWDDTPAPPPEFVFDQRLGW